MHGSLTEPEISQQSVQLQSQDRGDSQLEEQPLQFQKPRQPAVPVAICFMFGIAIDRFLDLPWAIWMIAVAGVAGCWVVFYLKKNSVLALASLLGCFLLLGGARHHLFWSMFRSDEISFFASEKSQLVNLTGTIATQPQIYPQREGSIESAWGQPDRTRCLVRCESILQNSSRVSVSGLAQLNVSGHLLHVEVGDEVQVRGWLSLPRGPVNPGEFDYRNYLRRHGVRAELYVEYPDAIRRSGRANSAPARRFAGRIKNYAETLFIKHLDERNVPVASALLLGHRSGLNHEIRDQFSSSGTMHLLAISGLHVGILVGLLWVCCRLLNLPPLTTAGVIVTVVVGYHHRTAEWQDAAL
jgi:competence protein ComEC